MAYLQIRQLAASRVFDDLFHRACVIAWLKAMASLGGEMNQTVSKSNMIITNL